MAKKEFSKLNNKGQKTIITLIGISVIFFILEAIGVLNFFEAPLQKILLPAQIGISKTRNDIKDFLGTISSIKSLREKETKTSYENAILGAENAKLKKLEIENIALRKQLGALKLKPELIVAEVIGQDALISSNKLLIDKGRADGVIKGNLVIIEDILIGEIVALGDSSATVRLLSDSDTKIPAETADRVRGILRGRFGNRIILEKVVQGKKLSKGEIVFSSGEADMPKGLVLGKISKVEKNPSAIFQKAEVEPIISYERLEIVFIIKSGL